MVSVLGVAYLATCVGLLGLLVAPLRQPEKPGSKGFILAILGISLWPLSTGVNTFVSSLPLSITIWNFRLLAAAIVSVGWFLVAYEFTLGRLPERTALGGFAIYVLLGQVITWTNPMHGLVLGPGTTVQNGMLLPVFGDWFWVQTVVNYSLIVGATGLLATDALRSHGLRRQQATLLAIAVVPPIVANLVTITNVVATPHDLTPFGLVGSGLILSWTLYRLEFLSVVPVGRDIAMDVMEDAVITVDDASRIIDCNAAARRLLDIEPDYYGTAITAVMDRLPDSLHPDRTRGPGDAEPPTTRVETTIHTGGEPRHFLVTQSPVTVSKATQIGTVLVFRDVTALKRREEDLELLRQILSRVLRHDLRTNVNIIEGYTNVLLDESGDDHLHQIVEATQSLKAIAEKTGDLDRIIDTTTHTQAYELRSLVTDAVSRLEATYPTVTVTVTGPAHAPVESVAGLPLVLENLLENSVEHTETTAPTVSIKLERRETSTVLRIVDSGPGIPDAELEVLASGEETPLSHGSGIGLWIVKWWADRVNATITFDTGPAGTTTTLDFPAESTT